MAADQDIIKTVNGSVAKADREAIFSAHMDIFVGSNDDDGLDTLVTIGGEGIIVLDNYPSFPIRGSLGFNAKDLFNWMKGEIGLTDVEFELFIGLHYFY